jgi:hypothetical protein
MYSNPVNLVNPNSNVTIVYLISKMFIEVLFDS